MQFVNNRWPRTRHGLAAWWAQLDSMVTNRLRSHETVRPGCRALSGSDDEGQAEGQAR